MSFSSSLPYSSSSEYLLLFSMLPSKFYISWQSPSHLQNSEHPIYDHAQEHAIVLHFETKIKGMFSIYVFSKTVSAVNLDDQNESNGHTKNNWLTKSLADFWDSVKGS